MRLPPVSAPVTGLRCVRCMCVLLISDFAHTSALPSWAAVTGLLLAKPQAVLHSHSLAHQDLLEVGIRREPPKSSVF